MEVNARILVMEDEALVRLMICSRLEQEGALVSEAGCCADALELVRNTDFDVAIFDYRLPDGDGLHVVRHMRNAGVGLPVIMLSGESTELAADVVKELDICAVFSKPADMAQLTATVARVVGGTSVKGPARVGRYVCCKVGSSGLEGWDGSVDVEWLALDLSECEMVALHPSIMKCAQGARRGVAVVGAGSAVREQLETLDVKMDFVADVDELAALSRHPSSPAERAALLGVTIPRQ